MKTFATKILAAVMLAALVPATDAAIARTDARGDPALSINGVDCPELYSWSGGDATAVVVADPAGTGATPRKRIVNFAYAPIVMVVALPLSPALQNCLSDLCANRPQAQTLLLTNVNGHQLQANHALLTEVRFPALDAASKDAWRLTMIFRPESTQLASGSAPARSPTARTASGGNFRFGLGALPVNQVSRIEAFAITSTTPAPEVGADRSGTATPGFTQIPDLSVTVGPGNAADWASWRDDFIVQGNSADAKEKSGTLEVLSADMHTVLLSLQLGHVGIKRLAQVPGFNESLENFRAELYCETMSVASGPVTSATTPAPTPGSPAPAPAPAGATPPPETAPADPKAPGDPKAPAKEPAKTPETAPKETGATTAGATGPSGGSGTNPQDKGPRDPADFPRANDTIRTQYSAVRSPGFIQEMASYTTEKSKSTALMAFYEERLKGSGWEETARYENDDGTDHAHQITSTWKKDIRLASLTFVDTKSGLTTIQVTLQERK